MGPAYKRAGSWWRLAQVAIWLLIALLGLLGAVLAATKTQTSIAVLAGGLVATLTAFTSSAHPGRQADGYENARLAIRDQTHRTRIYGVRVPTDEVAHPRPTISVRVRLSELGSDSVVFPGYARGAHGGREAHKFLLEVGEQEWVPGAVRCYRALAAVGRGASFAGLVAPLP
jgi:hypothetical protein